MGAAAVGATVGLLAAVLCAVRPALFERGEWLTYDWRARSAAADSTPRRDIIVVHVDDEDLASVEAQLNLTWPWPRELFGYIADYAVQGGARAVMLDWIFQDRGVWGVDDLEGFADTLRENGKTVVGMVTQWRRTPDEAPAARRLVRVAETPTRAEALTAGVRLLSWNARVYLAGDGPTTIYVAGADDDKARQSFMRLSSLEELAEVFGIEDDAPPPDPPTPVASDGTGAVELTASRLVSERIPIDIPLSSEVSLPAVTDMPPIAQVAAAAPGIGSVSQKSDDDGVLRQHAFFLATADGRVVPSLPMAAFLLAHPDAAPRIDADALHLGGRSLAIESDGRVVVRYHRSRAFREIGAADILSSVDAVENGAEPKVPLATFADSYVIVSASARALRDVRTSPVDPRHLGAEINAMALDNLLTGVAIDRVAPMWDAAVCFLFVLFGAVAVAGSATLVGSAARGFVVTAATAAAVLGAYVALSTYLMGAQQIWLATFTPMLAAGVAMVGAVLIGSVLDARDRRFVQDALGRYTSRELVDELVAHPEKLSLEWGEKREMSVYFSDIAGFTSISETVEPLRMVALLNDYLTRMTDIVLEHHGVVDKYIGDAVMAFWGAPLDSEDHAFQAVSAALAMKRVCDEQREHWKAEYGVEVYARAGVNSGVAVAGNMGSKHKYNYTVMGDMVNLAARLEGANKPYGTYLMISEHTRAATRGRFELRTLDFLAVKGKEEPVVVYEVLGHAGELDDEDLAGVRAFEAALELYRARDFAGAIDALEKVRALAPDDGPTALYLDRCRHFASEPPPPDWDGVWRMKEK